MVESNSHYGYVITDKHLVVFRLTRQHIESGIASTRLRRTKIIVYQSDDVSQSRDDSSSKDPTFEDNNPVNWRYHAPEYAVVPWSASGPNQLTVKLALWALAMMAIQGGNAIDYEYPPLKPYRKEDTSGARKTTQSANDVVN